MKVHYHAKTGIFIGLSMSSDELGSLHDVYQPLRSDHRTQKATYISNNDDIMRLVHCHGN